MIEYEARSTSKLFSDTLQFVSCLPVMLIVCHQSAILDFLDDEQKPSKLAEHPAGSPR